MAPLPTGTVTFLFTDIEGSTSRWEHQREAMQIALARHDAIMRAAIEAHAGHVFKTVGDAFYATFATAPDAVATALTAQHALQAETRSTELGVLRVRMALHTGVAEERNGDYFGPPLNRVARLLAVGYGGQTLLSHVTQELVRDQLPAGVELRDLGEHRLKDLIRPERVFQLLAPDLPTAFPPLKTLDNRPNNLPLQPNPLIGREREVEAVRQRLALSEVRLMTLTGVGGTGKTRLALQVAADFLDMFKDGVWFVNLASISDPNLVLITIATTLGVREAGGQPLMETVQAYLHDKQLLLLLDNFEQVLAAASTVAALLAGAAQLKVLVTSRAPLHLQGEREVPVPPLGLPDPKHLLHTQAELAAALSQYEAVRLFIERAQAVKPHFAVTNANAPAVAEICTRLDGLPLAIELAAARVKLLSPEALLQRLGSRLKVLTSGARDLPTRQQTLRSTIDWSHSLLEVSEQTLFRRLAVFVGGCSLLAVEAVCLGDEETSSDVLDSLALLIDNSLLRSMDDAEGTTRFGLFETIREYAVERLEASGEADAIAKRHADYYLGLAEQAQPLLQGASQAQWLDQLHVELDNLRAALETLVQSSATAEKALGFCIALNRFWVARDNLSEGRRWLDRALAAAHLRPEIAASTLYARALVSGSGLTRAQRDLIQGTHFCKQALEIYQQVGDKQGIARVLYELGAISYHRGEYFKAEACYEQSLTLYREIEDKNGVAFNLNTLGHDVAFKKGDYVRANALLEESLILGRDLCDLSHVAVTLHRLGLVALAQGRYDQAYRYCQEALEIFRRTGEKSRIAEVLVGGLGKAALAMHDYAHAQMFFEEGLAVYREREHKVDLAGALTLVAVNLLMYAHDYAQARSYLEEGLALYQDMGDRRGVAETLNNLAWIDVEQNNDEQARVGFMESLTMLQETGRAETIADCVVGLAAVASLSGKGERAAHLWGAAVRIATSHAFTLDNHPEYEPHFGRIRGQLDGVSFKVAWEEGLAMTLEQALMYALEEEQGRQP